MALHAVLLMLVLVLVLVLAGACTLVLLLGGRWIDSLLGGRGPVLAQTLAYSDVLFLGCVTIWPANALAAIVRATGPKQVAAKGLVAGSAVQVIAAGVLVFGPGPFPQMGIAGAAAGIVIGEAFTAILLLCFLTSRCVELRLRRSGMAMRLAPMEAILKVGALASVHSFCTLAASRVIAAFMARLGVDVLAGDGIGSRLEFLIIPLVLGFGAASTALVGVHFGANAADRGHRAGWTAAICSAAASGLVGALVALFPGLWANLFTDSEAVRAACRNDLQIAGPFYAFFGLALCLYFASQGAGRVAWPVVASVVRVLVIVFGCVLLAGIPGARPEHFCWLIAAGMVVQALISGMAIRLGAWARGRWQPALQVASGVIDGPLGKMPLLSVCPTTGLPSRSTPAAIWPGLPWRTVPPMALLAACHRAGTAGDPARLCSRRPASHSPAARAAAG